MHGVVVERWDGDDSSIPEITALLNAAYAELAAMGFKYVATWQDDAITRKRLARGEAYVAREVEGGRILGTITLILDPT